ncbi:MAG: PrsW family intramembrane metalloprotease, partial [Leptospiraceae bacterium]|nr:PrsW family intramembrane metalloprotease [Leptospiraceae bacterium]
MAVTAWILALISVAPLMLVLVWYNERNYPGPAGALWQRFIMPRLDTDSRQFICPAVYSGFLGGIAAAYIVLQMNRLVFNAEMLVMEPGSAVSWTLQMAFIQAGLLEEAVKCVLALGIALLWSYDKGRDRVAGSFILTATAVGLGFAFLENTEYMLVLMQIQGFMQALLARSMAALAHMLFGLCFGLFVVAGQARGQTLLTAAGQGTAAAVLLHGVFDFFAFPQGFFANTLTTLWLLLILTLLLRWYFRLMPDQRPSHSGTVLAVRLQRAIGSAENQGDALLADLQAALAANEALTTPYQYRERTAMNAISETGLPVIEFADILNEIPPPNLAWQEAFPTQRGAFHLAPGGAAAPFAMWEFCAARGMGSQLAGMLEQDMTPGELPQRFREEWLSNKQQLLQALQVQPVDCGSWNSSVFATDARSAWSALHACGIDLATIQPIQVLEFRIRTAASGESNPDLYVYYSQGLQALYGHECLVSLPHPLPSMRWFFLRLAMYVPEQAPWLKPFQVMLSDSSLSLGEPRGWWRAFMPVPLFGHLHTSLKNLFP